MKRFKIIIAIILALIMLVPTVAMAEETTEEPPAEELVTEEPAEEDPVAEEEPWVFEDVLGEITEESPLYPVRQLFEGVTFEITVDESGLSSLTISFMNQAMFEEALITEDMLAQLQATLIEKIERYLIGEEEEVVEEPAEEEEELIEPPEEEIPGAEAEEPVEEPVEDPVVEEVPPVVIVIPLGEGLTEEQAAGIIEIAFQEVAKLFATESFIAAKDEFFLAKEAVTEAMNAWKEARKNGTMEEELAAFEALMAAREYKEEMEALKDAVEAVKEEIKLLVETDEEGDGPPWEENPSIQNKLESNGIGNGLTKIKGDDPEEETEQAKDKGKPDKEKTNNGKSDEKKPDKGKP